MSTFPHTCRSINTIVFQSFDGGISLFYNLEIYICFPSRPIMIICHTFHEGNYP